MMGDDNIPGVIPLTVREIFQQIENIEDTNSLGIAGWKCNDVNHLHGYASGSGRNILDIAVSFAEKTVKNSIKINFISL
jgi:hypothetical protein